MNPYQGRTGPLGLDELEDLTEVLGEKTVRRLILAEKERQKLRKRLEAIADHELKMTKCVLADCGLPIDLNGPMDNLKQKDGYYAHVICPSKDPMHSKDHCAHGVLKRRSCDVCDAVTHEYYAARRKPKVTWSPSQIRLCLTTSCPEKRWPRPPSLRVVRTGR